MHKKLQNLILYRPEKDLEFFSLLTALDNPEGADFAASVGSMIKIAVKWGLKGNLWHCCLTLYLAFHTNPFSMARERRDASDNSLSAPALWDFRVFMDLFKADLSSLLPEDLAACVTSFTPGVKSEFQVVGDKISPLAKKLARAETPEEFFTLLTEHYKAYGVGFFGHNSFFRLDERGGGQFAVVPVTGGENITLDTIVGCDEQKNALLRNTAALVNGRKGNNVLLYGDSGTGKSTCVKALVNRFSRDGLKLVEIYKHQFRFLPELVSDLRRRNYPFIIFIDDLSFEDFEVEYKSLKAVIEGGVETRPENVLIYATSNRRHLVREDWSDRSDMTHSGDVHRSDTLEEKLSLAGRFGLQINFSAPRTGEYHEIVLTLARKAGIDKEEKDLFTLADAWEIRHGGKSGRVAEQFVDYLLSEKNYRDE